MHLSFIVSALLFLALGVSSQQHAQVPMAAKLDVLSVTASSTWDSYTPEKVLDSSNSSGWNAGTFAPSWINLEFPSPQVITGIVAVVNQSPEGHTKHELSIDGVDHHVWDKFTRNMDALEHGFLNGVVGSSVRVRTVESPSWVAWREISVFGYPAVVPLPVSNAIASATWQNYTPENVLDHNPSTNWNSGQFAPSWIELQFASSHMITHITATTNQSPAGDTVHEIYVDGVKVHTWAKYTEHAEVLEHVFLNGVSGSRVRILTVSSPSWVSWGEVNVSGYL